MFVSVTRLRVRGIQYLPGFLWHAGTSALQLRHSLGFICAELSPDLRARTFWTVSVWHDKESMRAYRIAGAHMRAMPKLVDWCAEKDLVRGEEPLRRPRFVYSRSVDSYLRYTAGCAARSGVRCNSSMSAASLGVSTMR
jgi:hypothetical protein